MNEGQIYDAALQSTSWTLAMIRKRPGMYVGGSDLFGLINYVLAGYYVLFEHHATKITVDVCDEEITLIGDISLSLDELNMIDMSHYPSQSGLSLSILAALSSYLSIRTNVNHQTISRKYVKGHQLENESVQTDDLTKQTTLIFAPDQEFFAVRTIAPAVMDSYLNRMCYLHPTTKFILKSGSIQHSYHEPRGLQELHRHYSAGFQLMHKPLHIIAKEDGRHMELVFAFQSWRENHLLLFVNNGRTVEGGTHEDGLREALSQISSRFHLNNGVIAVLSVTDPEVVYEGCVKEKVANENLRGWIEQIVIEKVNSTLNEMPELFTNVGLFKFPGIWTR